MLLPVTSGYYVRFRQFREKFYRHAVLDSCLLRSRNSAFPRTLLRLVRRVAPETSREGHLQNARDAIAGVVTALVQ